MPTSVATYDRFSMLAPRYDLVLCDVWGVVHNGVHAYVEACDALARFRAGGGTVILITNAPRPSAWVIHQLDRFGISRDAYDGVTTSGDVTRDVMSGRGSRAVFHVGPERDISIFDGLDVRFSPIETAEYTVCTGLFDDTTETPEDYRGLLETMQGRRMFMLCANPDLVVERGSELVYCAGAIADLYVSMGGEALYAGKPHRPIYDLAFSIAAAARGTVAPPQRILAIGDSLRTDITGARALGIDGLFVSGGIHAEELGSRDSPSSEALAAVFAAAGVTPHGATARLVW
jgi:HAD superfamily hydrolase (TIGR01459 family)